MPEIKYNGRLILKKKYTHIMIDAGSEACFAPIDAGSEAYFAPIDAGSKACFAPIAPGTSGAAMQNM